MDAYLLQAFSRAKTSTADSNCLRVRSALLFFDANIAYSCSMRTNEETNDTSLNSSASWPLSMATTNNFALFEIPNLSRGRLEFKKPWTDAISLISLSMTRRHSEIRGTASTASGTASGQLTAKLID